MLLRARFPLEFALALVLNKQFYSFIKNKANWAEEEEGENKKKEIFMMYRKFSIYLNLCRIMF